MSSVVLVVLIVLVDDESVSEVEVLVADSVLVSVVSDVLSF